jgi:hypothetical protein
MLDLVLFDGGKGARVSLPRMQDEQTGGVEFRSDFDNLIPVTNPLRTIDFVAW